MFYGDGSYIIGNTHNAIPTLTQRLLSSTNPAFVGGGAPLSKVKFAADGTLTGGAITSSTQGFGTASDGQFQLVNGLDINGQYSVGQGTHNALAGVGPGILLDGQGACVQDCIVHGFKGNAVSARLLGFKVLNNTVYGAYTGITGTSDSCFIGNTVFNCRDYGLYIPSLAGNVYSAHNHYYGCNPDDDTTTSAAAYIGSSCVYCNFTDDRFADSIVGVKNVYGQGISFVNCYWQHNTLYDLFLTGATGCQLTNCNISCMRSSTQYGANGKYGIWCESGSDRFTMQGGSINLATFATGITPNGYATCAIFGADYCSMDNVSLTDEAAINGSKAIVLSGARSGFRAKGIKITGFEGTTSRVLVAASAPQDIDCEFHGEFVDLTNPGTEDVSGIKKYIDIAAGWTGSIKLIKGSTGATVSLTPGTAY